MLIHSTLNKPRNSCKFSIEDFKLPPFKLDFENLNELAHSALFYLLVALSLSINVNFNCQ